MKKKIVILILFISCISLLFYKITNEQEVVVTRIEDVKNKLEYDEETVKLINQKLTEEEIKELENRKKINNLDLFIKEKYYLHKNLDEYLSYYELHLDLEANEVVALVNVKASKTAYVDVNNANLDKGNLVLVNKYNSLDANYEPNDLVVISEQYAYKDRKIKKDVNDAFINMYNAALKDGVKIFVTSAYRSYSYQETLYFNYISMYGEEYTNTVSAKPGFSEHQTGLALDILSPNVKMNNFKNTIAYEWLKENSYKYGFILRYPENKTHLTGYAFESWHYRYVGEDIALKVYSEDITYDEYYAFYLDN